MKKVKTNKLLQIFTLLLLSGLLWCCTDERERYEPTDTDKLKTVTFSVKVPGGSAPKTYALAEGDENEVSSIAILLFDGDGNYTYQPIYNNTITTDPSDSKIKTFTVNVPEGTYNMMVLANANASLAAALSSINTGDSKASVVSKLLLSNGGKWNAVPGSAGYIPIPMWGEITGLAVSSSMPANNPVTLIRMVSKIDVSLDTAAKGKFNLQSVRLYNYNDQGQIAPTATNWSSTTNVATAPSVPASAQKPTNPVSSSLLFDDTTITKDPTDLTRGVSCLNEIYTFEAPMGSSSALSSNTCLVVGGVYDGDAQATYYRIDLANTTGTGASATVTYLALLRNHRYKINITNVKGSGLPTHEDAFNSRPVNIVANVVEWNEALITDIKFDEQYILGVSQGEFTFSREARTATSDDNTLYVTTDYPTGWSVQKIIDAGGNDVSSVTNPAGGWLSITPTTGASGATVPTRLLLTENNTSQTRTAYMHLTAGRLSYIVKVQQSIDATLSITITNASGSPIDVLEFASTIQEVTTNTAPGSQTFNLNWSPASSTLLFTSTTINTRFAFASGAGLDNIPASGTLTSGSKSYTIQPTAIDPAQLSADPFYERSSIYLYTVSDGTATVNKTLTLRQYAYNLIANAQSTYFLNGATYTFYVRSNTGWRIKTVTPTVTQGSGDLLNLQASDNLRVGTTGGINTGVGTPVSFRVVDNRVNLRGKVDVVFESVDNPQRFNNVTVTFYLTNEYYPAPHNGWAGSNIYWDGSKLTFDDVGDHTHEKYQGVYFQWGSLYGISPKEGALSATTVLYPPSGVSGTASSLGYDTWFSLPRIDDVITSNPPSDKTVGDRAYLYEITDGNARIGDICKYMTEKGWAPPGKKWRMPTYMEFKEMGSYSGWVSGSATTANDSGTGITASGRTKDDIGTPFFPASGCRLNTSGQVHGLDYQGDYWSSSSNDFAGAAGSMEFTGSSIYQFAASRDYGCTIRCVVDKQ